MDDLLGEDWQRAANKTVPANTSKPSPFAAGFNLTTSSLQPSRSGASTPSSIVRPASTNNGGKPAANDSFGGLLSLKSQGSGKSLSMQERQQQILEQKRRQQEQDTQLWNNLGSRSATPDQRRPSPAAVAQAADDTDDILAAFNRSAPVNAATHFPPPVSESTTGKNSPAPFQSASSGTATGQFDDDDDPFGLAQLAKSNNVRSAPSAPTPPRGIADDDDDDILGDLAKPVSQSAPKRDLSRTPEVPQQANDYAAPAAKENPQDKLIAELVDMGFPAGSARIALNESGDNVEAAVSWLLRQAHEESKQKAQAESRRQASPAGMDGRSYRQDGSLNGRSRGDERSSSGTRRPDSQRTPAGEKDPGQMAQEFGSKLFKSANSLWKASQKQMAKTMAEFQQERDHSQPKWMQESHAPSSSNGAPSRPARDAFLTDEAALLDAPREAGRGQTASAPRTNGHESKLPFRDSTETKPRPVAARPRDSPPVPSNFADKRPAAKLSRQDVEEQSAQAYISPARRRKATPVNDAPPKAEVDLFSPDPGLVTNSAPAKPPPPKVVRPAQVSPAPRAQAIPPRTIPQVSPAVLATSSRHRKAGGEAFKRGDYAAAHDSYGAALAGLPERHPVLIIVLCNRSLTGLKTGDAKTAIVDAERALEIIGAGQGVGEKIDAGPGEESKEMRDFYGKALMRKAEALEHVERWTDAAAAWRQAVEAGVGGAVSIRGRDRCERAAAPKPPPLAAPSKPKAAAPSARKPPTATRLGHGSAASSRGGGPASGDAVQKLRAANAAAEKADDERFALADQVDARLTAWRGGKADNLRALLQSLDGVLWAAAGWKKVGMSDLVMPNKVKIIYMKAIAKVHPDKIPQDATTEQRMISGAVFSTLNEAWDKFKKDNNL